MDAAGASVVPRDAIRRLICYTVGMSTTPQHDNHDEYTIETMTAALRERGIAHTVEHTGGGITTAPETVRDASTGYWQPTPKGLTP